MEYLRLLSYLVRLTLIVLLIGIGMKMGCFAQLTSSFETREPQNKESTIDFDEDTNN